MVTNVPGQSGQPESPFYGNLLPLWDRGEYFPLVYTRARRSRGGAQADAETGGRAHGFSIAGEQFLSS